LGLCRHTIKQSAHPEGLPPLPCRYEGIISLLCENLDTLDEPEAKAAMVWVLGELFGAFHSSLPSAVNAKV
jgi:hypothetical protein